MPFNPAVDIIDGVLEFEDKNTLKKYSDIGMVVGNFPRQAEQRNGFVQDLSALLKHLASQEGATVRKLSLANNNLTREDLEKVAKLIENNTTLEEIDLSNNLAIVENLSLLVNALQKNKSLRHIKLAMTDVIRSDINHLSYSAERGGVIGLDPGYAEYESFCMSPDQSQAVVELFDTSTLLTIDLSGFPIRMGMLPKICTAICGNRVIQGCKLPSEVTFKEVNQLKEENSRLARGALSFIEAHNIVKASDAAAMGREQQVKTGGYVLCDYDQALHTDSISKINAVFRRNVENYKDVQPLLRQIVQLKQQVTQLQQQLTESEAENSRLRNDVGARDKRPATDLPPLPQLDTRAKRQRSEIVLATLADDAPGSPLQEQATLRM